MTAPAALVARGPDGAEHQLVGAGAALPAGGRLVLATQRPGQAEVAFDLLEVAPGAEPRRVARATFELPRGLPANTWIPVEVSVGADLRVRAEAREQLRRLRVAARFDAADADAEHYRT